MRSIALAASIAIAASLAPAQSPLRITSFNIRYGTAADGDNLWDRRRDLVVTTIREQTADLVGLQEALDFQLDYLTEHLPGYLRLGIGRDAGGKGEHAAILVSKARFEVLRHGDFWLSPTPDVPASRGWDAALPRICTWAVLRDRTDGAVIAWLNTHFDHRGVQAREESGKQIARWLEDFAGLPTLVTGDLNSGETSPALNALRAAGLRDTFRVLHPDAERAGTFCAFRGTDSGAKIDYVFCDARWEVRAAEIDRREFEGRYPSDHFPVVAELVVREPSPPRLMPVLRGESWRIGTNPDLGELSTPRQEAVDHAIFRDDGGKWRLWSCIRGTKVGRVLFEWVGDALETTDWSPTGIAMRAEPARGESVDDWNRQEWIQAPFVLLHQGVHHMFYGGHRSELGDCQICLATSADGTNFEKRSDARGYSRVFVGPGEARDAMVLEHGGTFFCYYSGHEPGERAPCKVYVRTSRDLIEWGEPRAVCWGGVAGNGAWSAECPFVVERDGAFFLFRTTDYRAAVTHVYRSNDPLDFGGDSDAMHIGTIAVAAPEVVGPMADGRSYISSVHELRDGIRLSRLAWVPELEAPSADAFLAGLTPLWDFESGDLQGWKAEGEAFADQPTFANGAKLRGQHFGPQGHWFIGTYERRPAADSPADGERGDTPTGSMRSPDFSLPAGQLSFLIGGGADRERTYVALHLVADDRELFRASGSGRNKLARVAWNVSAHAGEAAYLRVVDASSAPWGHINVDDFRASR